MAMQQFTSPPPLFVRGDVVGEHGCPTCGAAVTRRFRPGRARIYCTNACRQRAYRWRRSHGVRLCVERNGATERLTNRRTHALRDPRDPASKIRDQRGRELAVCGTFARPVRADRVTHTAFVPEGMWACATCVDLIGAGPPGSGIPDVVVRFWERYFAERGQPFDPRVLT